MFNSLTTIWVRKTFRREQKIPLRRFPTVEIV